MTLKFNAITQGMLEEYERQLFEVQNKRISGGAVRFLVANIQAGFDAGWIEEPFDGFKDSSWKKKPPSAEQTKLLTDMVAEIDAKYTSFVVIDPNG